MLPSSHEIASLLRNSLSPNNKLREDASKYLQTFEETDQNSFILSLYQCYLDSNIELDLRKLAGLAIKNALISRERKGPRQLALNERWNSFTQDSKTFLKSFVSQSLALENSFLSTTTAQIVSAIAYHEIPSKEWPELVPYLLELSSVSSSSIIKRTCIETLGYISELVGPNCLYEFSSQFLTVIIGNMTAYQADVDLATVSCRALLNSVAFISANYEREAERDCIMSTLLTLAAASINSHDSSLIELSCLSWETIVKIIQYYYPLIEKYLTVEDTLQLCRRSISSDHDSISLQAIEVWSCLSEIEEDFRHNLRNDLVCYSLTEKCFPLICPSILERLYYPQEVVEIDQDEWIPQMAASTCLSLVCACLGDKILNNHDIITFIQNGISSSLWNHKEAALMAFGSLLEIPQKELLDSAVKDMLPTLLMIIDTESLEIVLDSATWVLGKIFDYYHHIVPVNSVGSITATLCKLILSRNANVVNNCSWALMNLVIQFGSLEEEDELLSNYSSNINPVSPFIREIISTLLKTTSRSDIDFGSVSTAIFQCAHGVIETSDPENIEVVQEICQFLINSLQSNYENQQASPHSVKVICGYFLLLQACFKKLGKSKVSYLFPTIVSVSIAILNQYSVLVVEDVLPCVSVLTAKCPNEFLPHCELFFQFFEKLTRSECDDSVLSACFEFVDDLIQKVGELSSIMKFHQLVFNILSNISSKKLSPNLLSKVIQYIGDVALFSPSLFSSDNVKFIDALKICCIELTKYMELGSDEESMETAVLLSIQALSCVFQTCEALEIGIGVYSSLPQFLFLVEKSLNYISPPYDYRYLKSVFGLLGDICTVFPKEFTSLITECDLIKSVIYSSEYDNEEEIRKLRYWVRNMVN